MDTEDESTAYLKYLNDTSNNYLLGNNVGLTDTFPFAEIESSDWPTVGFSVLLSNPLITEEGINGGTVSEDIQLFNQAEVAQNNNAKELAKCDITAENPFTHVAIMEENGVTKPTKKTYINYAPIVKEGPDGNKEIYLTEKDINNDASVIQLFNTDGSVITLDKSILSSLNLPKKIIHETETTAKNKYSGYFSAVTAIKCKVCNFLCETEEEIKTHLEKEHAELFVRQSSPINKQTSVLKSKFNNGVNEERIIFLCSICKIPCNTKDELKDHMINKHMLGTANDEIKNPSDVDEDEEYIIFLCSYCQIECRNKDELKQHILDEHELVEANYEINIVEETASKAPENNCEKKSLRSISSFLIKQQEKARKKVKCLINGCNLRFARDDLRQRHEECHVGENKNQFKCTQCNETFSIWRICSNHLWKCHKIDLGLLTCPMCNIFKSNSTIRVLNHMAVHNEERPFLCSDCGKGFKTMVQLKNHGVIHMKPENLPNWSIMRQCDICERYFANSKCLRKHIQTVHEQFKPFICNICGHKTARKAMLELHLRQHTGAKPHQCSYCEYRTGDHNCLRKHIMRHIGATKYHCPHCPYTSIQSASYKNHLNNRHPGKSGTYSCSYCSSNYINVTDYSAHMKCHEAALRDSGNGGINQKNQAVDNQLTNRYLCFVEDVDDSDTQNCFLNIEHTVEETVDKGGITIPAGCEMQLVS